MGNGGKHKSYYVNSWIIQIHIYEVVPMNSETIQIHKYEVVPTNLYIQIDICKSV